MRLGDGSSWGQRGHGYRMRLVALQSRDAERAVDATGVFRPSEVRERRVGTARLEAGQLAFWAAGVFHRLSTEPATMTILTVEPSPQVPAN
jgi:hypothetical protein